MLSNAIMVDDLCCTAQVVVDSALKGEQPQLCKLLTEPGWLEILGSEMEKHYFSNLEKFLHDEWSDPNTTIYPPAKDIFRAFECTSYDK